MIIGDVTAFGLGLRIGFVPVVKIRKQGKDVLVARYEVSAGNNLAMFAGGVVELADRLGKDDDLAKYRHSNAICVGFDGKARRPKECYQERLFCENRD